MCSAFYPGDEGTERSRDKKCAQIQPDNTQTHSPSENVSINTLTLVGTNTKYLLNRLQCVLNRVECAGYKFFFLMSQTDLIASTAQMFHSKILKLVKAVPKVGHSNHCLHSYGTHQGLTSLNKSLFLLKCYQYSFSFTSEYGLPHFKPCQTFLLVFQVALIDFEKVCRAGVDQKLVQAAFAEGH